MTIEEYESGVWRTWNYSLDKKDQILNAALGLGEAGEVQNLVKKYIYHKDEEAAKHIIDELGDLLYYITILATAVDERLERVMIYNHHKLFSRYPEGFKEGGGIRD
jgi:NTP pyrophosphatase (non-canonical NTP hydrolase)